MAKITRFSVSVETELLEKFDGIIEKMGGKLEVESTVETGTTFLVSIPFQTEAGRQH